MRLKVMVFSHAGPVGHPRGSSVSIGAVSLHVTPARMIVLVIALMVDQVMMMMMMMMMMLMLVVLVV